jgi:hypothetical protein
MVRVNAKRQLIEVSESKDRLALLTSFDEPVL